MQLIRAYGRDLPETLRLESKIPVDELSHLMKRITLSSGLAVLRLEDGDTDQIAEDVEAFLIAIFQLTENSFSYVAQDIFIRSVCAQADSETIVQLKGCEVEAAVSAHSLKIGFGFDGLLCLDELSCEMLQALEEIRDPAGMIMAGMAAVPDWGAYRSTAGPAPVSKSRMH